MRSNSVEKFEEAVSIILGEIAAAQCSDVSGIGIRPEHEGDLRRVSEALLPLLKNLARMKHLWIIDPTISSGRREVSDKMFCDDNDIILPR